MIWDQKSMIEFNEMIRCSSFVNKESMNHACIAYFFEAAAAKVDIYVLIIYILFCKTL